MDLARCSHAYANTSLRRNLPPLMISGSSSLEIFLIEMQSSSKDVDFSPMDEGDAVFRRSLPLQELDSLTKRKPRLDHVVASSATQKLVSVIREKSAIARTGIRQGINPANSILLWRDAVLSFGTFSYRYERVWKLRFYSVWHKGPFVHQVTQNLPEQS